MFKRIVTGCLVGLIPFSVLALSCNDALADGLYIGGEAGYATGDIDKKVNINYSSPFNMNNQFKTNDHIDNGIGGIYGGFGKLFNSQYYLGVEADALLGSGSSSTVSDGYANKNFSVHEKMENNYSLNLMPGYVIAENVMLYGKAGVDWAKFESSSSDAGILGSSGNFDKTLAGAQLGLGLEVYLNCNWSIRGEYDYIDYKNFSRNSGSAGLFTGGVSGNVNTHYRINQQLAMVGISYHFDGLPNIFNKI